MSTKLLLLFIAGILLPFESPASEMPFSRQECFGMNQASCEVFHLTNVERTKKRLAKLKYCQRCFEMAQEQSEDMSSRGYFDHARPAIGKDPGESFSRRAARFGLSNGVGENIAINHTAVNAVVRWMKSPGHRRNILSTKYDSFAVGAHQGMYTQVFWNSRSSR